MNQYLYRYIKDLPKGTALDLGCGPGFDVACLRHLGWSVDGVDKKTGTDLELPYRNPMNTLYDLVYSNYVLHFLKNKHDFAETVYRNLKDGGKFFVHTLHISDEVSKGKGLPEFKAIELFKNFQDVKIELIDHFDNAGEDGEGSPAHWHKILQITGQKKERVRKKVPTILS